jgi:acyl carrier protein
MEEKIKEIIATVFNENIANIGEDASQDTIEGWDSLNHMNLVVMLEEEFEIEFDDDEISELLNFKLISHIIKQKINQ